jgi:hypothetical protein
VSGFDILIFKNLQKTATLYFLKLQEKYFKESVTFISLDLPHSIDMAVNKLISTFLLYKIKKELNKTIKKIF